MSQLLLQLSILVCEDLDLSLQLYDFVELFFSLFFKPSLKRVIVFNNCINGDLGLWNSINYFWLLLAF